MIYTIKAAVFIELILLAAVALFRGSLQLRERYILTVGDVLLVAAIPLVGLFGIDKTVFYGFLFVAPLFWTGDPVCLAKRYLLALVSFPELSTEISVGGHYLGTWSALLSLNAGGLVALAATRRKGNDHQRSIEIALWLVFVVALLLSARGADTIGTLRAAITAFVLIVPPFYIVSRTLGSAKAMTDALSFVILGGVCNACIGLVEAVKHWAIYENLAGALHVKMGLMSANLSVRAGLLRAGGAFINYELYGLFCGMSLLAAIGLRRRFTAGGFAMIVMVLVAGLLVSQARSAWIATAVGLVVQAAYDRRWGRVATCLGGFGLVAMLVLTVLPQGGRAAQLMGASGHGASTNEYRQRLLDRGLEEARLHPWTGQTLDQLQVSMDDLRQGEHIIDFVNTHLNVLLVGGVGALVVWFIALAMPIVAGWRSRPVNARNQDPLPASVPLAWLVMIMLFLAFTSAVDRAFPFTTISMALIAVAFRVGRRKQTAPVFRLSPTTGGDSQLG